MVSLLFAAIAVLHITTPTVVSVEAVAHNTSVSAKAVQMPSRLLSIGDGSDNLRDVGNALPYLYAQRNLSSSTVPPGMNDT